MLQDRFGSLKVRPPIELAVAAAARRPVSARDKYLRDWKIVRRARFNAAKRFERKQSASTLAFALAGVIGFLLPFYVLLFKDALSTHTKNVLDFTAYVTGALSLMVGLIEQAKDYPAKARRFDLCGRRVNVLARRLALSVHHDLGPLSPHRAVRAGSGRVRARITTISIMTSRWRSSSSRMRLDKEGAKRQLARLKLIESVTIYWLYAATWVTPTLVRHSALVVALSGSCCPIGSCASAGRVVARDLQSRAVTQKSTSR